MIEYVKLGKIAKIYSGGTPSRTNPAYWGGDIPWVKTTQIQDNVITEDSIDEWITEEGLKKSSAKMVPKGTILMAMYGQGKTRGKVAVLGLDAAINQACAAIQVDKGLNRDFVFQQLLFRYNSIRAMSNSGSQENLSLGLISEIEFPLPPLPKQNAIAGLLSAWDQAIDYTQRLIAAKEKRFSWLLLKLINQDNLTGNLKRVNLGDVCQIKKGQQLSKVDMIEDGKYYVLNGGITPSGRTDKWNTPENTITISEGGNSCGFINFNTEKFWSGGHCYSLICLKSSVYNIYLYHFLKRYEKQIMRLRVGSGLPNI